MVVLTMAMLLYGGVSLVDALSTLREPRSLAGVALQDSVRTSAGTDVTSKLVAISQAIVDRHRAGIKISAACSVIVSLFTLYTVAAILARDRRGRRLAVATGWLGVLYLAGSFPLGLVMAKQAAALGTPVVVAALAESGKLPVSGSPEDLARKLQAATIVPLVVMSLIGASWCLLLVRYFGGRRGRLAYGLDRAPRDE